MNNTMRSEKEVGEAHTRNTKHAKAKGLVPVKWLAL